MVGTDCQAVPLYLQQRRRWIGEREVVPGKDQWSGIDARSRGVNEIRVQRDLPVGTRSALSISAAASALWDGF
ncbi:MAG: hypothetical protein EAZ71_04950 [Verrucomicrobia bacterium]|nr:MAG: hypothetical protein EAZ82_03425 [Verrucomicrobiota bacterium]TAF26564.1 MAG: hypothetical protein EAZ71_04950 [Verrucomicrobiota bacterium]